jgi:tetratricopeptide (TPR) repeat protein
MQLVLRILIYLSLLVGTMWFGYSTYRDYSLLMIDGVGGAEVETVKYAEMETRTQTAVVAAEENPEEDGGLDLSDMLDDEENYRAVRINNNVSRHYVRLIGNTVAFGFLLTVVGFLFAQNIGDVLRFRMNQKIQYVDEYSEKNEDAERGIYLLRKGKHQQALEILRKIVQADPEAWEATTRPRRTGLRQRVITRIFCRWKCRRKNGVGPPFACATSIPENWTRSDARC